MGLKVVHDGEDECEIKENCCSCHKPTNYWHHTGVALCPPCAKISKRGDLPSKAKWIEDTNRRALVKKKVVDQYLPQSVSLGSPLTIAGLTAIVLHVKTKMSRAGFTHAVVKGSQSMMENELEELGRLLRQM